LKVLVLSCSTGEGHNSAARAVIEALALNNTESEFIDPISFKSEKMMHRVSSIYNNMIIKVPTLFGVIYKIGAIYDSLHLKSPVAWANSKYADKLSEYIKSKGFDAIVCTQLFTMQAMVAAKKKHGIDLPVYCVLTDYTVIPFYKDVKSLERHFVPTDKIKDKLIKQGFTEKQIEVTGIPTSPKFNIPLSKIEAKRMLSIPKDKKVISILSGGAGCGKILKTCKEMSKRLDDSHVICVFTGRNEKLKDKLEETFGKNSKIKIVTFTPDINVYIKASDVVLSKPGGLSSTEIAAANRPLVHMKAIPGCESYNIKYFNQNGLSIPGKSVKAAVKQTERLLNDERLAEEIERSQRALIPGNAAEIISNIIIEDSK
jgi:processive 1,2-diacylglycerol beta-glucosyltransferase